jgi:hypothetical protein
VKTNRFGRLSAPLALSLLLLFGISAHAKTLEIVTADGPLDFSISDDLTDAQFTALETDLVSLGKIDLPAQRSATSIAIFGANTKNYLTWFAAHVQAFELNPNSAAQVIDGGVSYTAASYQSDHSILLDDYFLEPSSDVRMATLVHEARHGDNVHHVRCTRAAYPQLRANLINQDGECDADETGAYGAQFIFEVELLSHLPHETYDTDEMQDDLEDISGRFLSAHSRAVLGADYAQVRKTARYLTPLTW